MKSLRLQAGLSPLGWLFLAMIAAFLALFAFKVGGIYFDNMLIKSTLEELGNEPNVNDMTSREIKSIISKKFQVNGVRDPEITGAVKVKKLSNKKLVSISYERRENLFYNIDLVLAFDNVLDTSAPNLCCTPLKTDADKKQL